MHTKIDNLVSLKPVGVLVEEFIVYCTNSRVMPETTVKPRKTHLTQFAKYCSEREVLDMRQVTPAFLDDYFSYYQSGHAISTTNTGRRIMKTFIQWVSGYKEMSVVNPDTIRLVREPKTLPKALAVSDVLKVMRACEDAQDALIINVLLESGIRIGEIVRLRVEDIHQDALMIHGKGAIERTVYVTDRLATAIEKFIRDNGRQSYEYLFQNAYTFGYGQQMTIGTVRLRVQKEFMKHDIVMVPHRIRHTFAINLLENGCDIVTIQKLLGHADIKTTMIYLNVTDKYLSERYKTYMKFA